MRPRRRNAALAVSCVALVIAACTGVRDEEDKTGDSGAQNGLDGGTDADADTDVDGDIDAGGRTDSGATADADSDTDSDTDTGIDAGSLDSGEAVEFILSSPAFSDNGTLPVIYTCDGAGLSPPLAWSGAPKGTVEFAMMMTTVAPDRLKWNWVLFHIPAAVTGIAENSSGVGTTGLTSDGPELRYYPPCSQGPGPKIYTFTVYALSGTPTFGVPESQVNGEILTAAIADLILAEDAISVSYTRQTK